jgi:para-nitrobenzyl esterase
MKQSLLIESGRLATPQPDRFGVRSFKGIPYAAPPVGPLRWRAPEPVAPWSGVRPTDRFAPNSIQGILFSDIDPYAAGISEDCLYLNIWTPARLNRSDRLPVMFWIHGGGFSVGSGTEPRYDGARLAARGIIVVTLNYRLNALGFLAHPVLTAETPRRASGNWGLLDLIEAMRWTRRNIEAFGGDPTAVTIAGESAGSSAVCALMASPLAKGLFARAIGQSGALFTTPARKLETLADAERAGEYFARKIGAKDASDLRGVPANDILAADPGICFRPIIDRFVLPQAPEKLFARRLHNDVPLLAGWNKDEGFNFDLRSGAPGRSYEDLVCEMFGPDAQAVLALYPSGNAETIGTSARALGGDVRITHPTWAWIEAQRRYGNADIYRFRFERAPLTPEGWFGDRPSRDAGAFHAGEIPYVFDTLDAFPWLIDDADRAIVKLASSYWVNFVKIGNPNGPGLPLWHSYRLATDPVMHIDHPPSLKPGPDDERHRLLASLASRLV